MKAMEGCCNRQGQELKFRDRKDGLSCVSDDLNKRNHGRTIELKQRRGFHPVFCVQECVIRLFYIEFDHNYPGSWSKCVTEIFSILGH